MPAALERKLKRKAIAKGFTTKKGGKRKLTKRGRRYVYGTMRKTGWVPSR